MTTYQYGGKKEDAFNVGWLERGYPVETGDVPQEFIDAVMESEDPYSDKYYQKVLEYAKGDDFWIAKDRTKD